MGMNFRSLTSIDISENDFEGELPVSIGNLSNLPFLVDDKCWLEWLHSRATRQL
jgi:hypothetical protein